MSLAVVFPGQGSQGLGMGKALFPRYADWVEMANGVLGYSIVDLCLKEEKKLNDTLYTQPALYVVNALSYRFYLESGGKEPTLAMGHSLGEYNALQAAGVFDFKRGLECVQKRAALMALESGGGMAAVLGMEKETLIQLIADRGEGVDIANFNSPGQYVISGPIDKIEKIEPLLKEAGARKMVRLNVSGAFHSHYMQPVQEKFLQFLEEMPFSPPKIKVIANENAEEYQKDEIKNTLASQISSPVRWIEAVNRASALGVDEFVEIGPGKVLTGLIKKIQRG